MIAPGNSGPTVALNQSLQVLLQLSHLDFRLWRDRVPAAGETRHRSPGRLDDGIPAVDTLDGCRAISALEKRRCIGAGDMSELFARDSAAVTGAGSSRLEVAECLFATMKTDPSAGRLAPSLPGAVGILRGSRPIGLLVVLG
jgi:hypothetical protein